MSSVAVRPVVLLLSLRSCSLVVDLDRWTHDCWVWALRPPALTLISSPALLASSHVLFISAEPGFLVLRAAACFFPSTELFLSLSESYSSWGRYSYSPSLLEPERILKSLILNSLFEHFPWSQTILYARNYCLVLSSTLALLASAAEEQLHVCNAPQSLR